MDDAQRVALPARRFRLRSLFYATACVGLFLAADRATVGTDLNIALRAMGVIVAWTCTVLLLEAWTYSERPD